jgi:hypothetical protein
MSEGETVEERQSRVGRNEALFRAINERLEELNEIFAVVTDDGFQIVCECGDSDCVDQFAIPTAEYVRIRKDPTLFIVLPGHEDPAVEGVVEEDRDAYVVVRKHRGPAARIATESAA